MEVWKRVLFFLFCCSPPASFHIGKIAAVGVSFAGLLSFCHVTEYLAFRDPANLLHYSFCTKSFSSLNLAREAVGDRLIVITLAFTLLAKLIAYIIIFIDRGVEKAAGFLKTN
jgi:hypothetical protein